jgi:cell division protein FtsL
MNLFPLAKNRSHVSHVGGLARLLPLTLVLVGFISFVVLVQTSGVATNGYDVLRLEKERDDWRQQNYQLEAEASALASLNRVEDVARNKLKMEPPKKVVFVEVDAKQ